MKKLLPLLLLALVFTSPSCKDDNVETVIEPNAYESRLEGSWNLTEVDYDASAPIIPIPIIGSATNVSGTLNLTTNPNRGTFDFKFDVDIMGTGIPIDQNVEGTWTVSNNNQTITIVDDATGDSFVLEVLLDQEKKQVFESTQSVTFQGAISADVKMTLTFTRP